MAEALLKTSAKRDVEVCSAGIKPGKKMNEHAVKAMREIGCDVSGHECTHISEFSDLTFDYVVKMDVPDLGDMVTAKWIVDWVYLIPRRVASWNTAKSDKSLPTKFVRSCRSS